MRLLTSITSHGFGHAAQALVVLNALMTRRPDIELHIATTVPKPFLAGRLAHPFTCHVHSTDFGLKMASALDIDRAASAAAYAAQAQMWDSLVEAEIGFLSALSPDLLLADIPYIPLAAAHKLGIPAVGLCSLNWAGIYRHYFHDRPEADAVLERLISAYSSARVFLTPEPFMPMPELDNTRAIGPLARTGSNRRDEIDAQLGLKPDDRLVLIALGGVQGRLPVERWPVIPGVHWLVQTGWKVERPGFHAIESLEMPFTDILASSDALLGKIGYGTVTECAVNATPMLYIPRADWPEEPYLAGWMEGHGAIARVDVDQAETGDLSQALQALLAQPPSSPPALTGAEEAVQRLLEVYGG
ncbi:glycosyltransferase [Thiohalobacter thiocyanaticus]|uniref:Glycosyltransferase n=1 Tax=Thiohalobacter thiocyanaticus TaxID=585455 RepID=A0A426QKQ4_9GAMM|nr:hypothetical protein [Thiohalobacter thiocyanaticus]RRQ22338.1 hypothetical protein D6C00_10510 [Thiohalobacter thiocyanaticus]